MKNNGIKPRATAHPMLNNESAVARGDVSALRSHAQDKLTKTFKAWSVEQVNALMASGGKSATYPVYDYRDLIDERIEIMSVRFRPSLYRDDTFAEAAFRGAGIDAGLIRIGGAPGRYFRGFGQHEFPMTLILRLSCIDAHGDHYRWDHVL